MKTRYLTTIRVIPSNQDVTSWKNPTLENTAVYQRATEEAREKILAEGIPNSPLEKQFAMDFIGIICVLVAGKTFPNMGLKGRALVDSTDPKPISP